MESKSKQPSISYVLFMYREQMRQGGETPSMRLSRTKLSLTDKLIRKTALNIDNCSMEDVMAINREIIFKKKLKQKILQRRQQQSQAAQEMQMK